MPQFNEDFIKSNNEESDERYFLEIDVQYPEKLPESHYNLQFYLKKWKLKKKLWENWVCYTNKKFKTGTLKKVHSVIKFNQNAWLKAYIDINNDVRKKSKSDFEKD